MKVITVVKFNQGEAFVVDHIPEIKFRKVGNDTLIGTNGIFYQFYGYEKPTKYAQAFGGRKFTIDLEDGNKVNCKGQWWDTITPNARKEINYDELTKITVNTYLQLLDCYVFYGYWIMKKDLDELREQYTGKVHEYNSYRTIIKKTC